MLSKENRLSASTDVVRTLKRGRSCPSKLWLIKWLPNNQRHPRFAFVVSNKISKRATVRNTIKRRLRHAVRQYGVSKVPNADIIVIAKSFLVNTPFKVISRALHEELSRCFYGRF
ncbi:MAG: ribonuclease P protein component [Patescibacteria group bacterium]